MLLWLGSQAPFIFKWNLTQIKTAETLALIDISVFTNLNKMLQLVFYLFQY